MPTKLLLSYHEEGVEYTPALNITVEIQIVGREIRAQGAEPATQANRPTRTEMSGT